MITKESIQFYRGSLISGDKSFLYIPSHEILQPYIANYTVEFPNPQTMPDEYTILPTASTTLIIKLDNGKIYGHLRGANTKAFNAGASSNKVKLLLLIEFHPGGLFPFFSFDQSEIIDSYIPLDTLGKELMQSLENELEKSEKVSELIEALDKIFIKRLMDSRIKFDILPVMKNIIKQHGFVNAKNISYPFYFSERQTRRLFLRHVGVNPQKFIRIVRTNYALRLIQNGKSSFLDVVEKAGYFDQSHFIHEFKAFHGITPQEYLQKMSVFYNDTTKM